MDIESRGDAALVRSIIDLITPYERALGLVGSWHVTEGVKALITAAQHYMSYQAAFAEGRAIDPDLTGLIATIEEAQSRATREGLHGIAELRETQIKKLRALIAAVYQDGPGLEEWGLRMKLDLSREDEARLSESAWEKLAQIIEDDLEPESGPAEDSPAQYIEARPVGREVMGEWLDESYSLLRKDKLRESLASLQDVVRAILLGGLDNA